MYERWQQRRTAAIKTAVRRVTRKLGYDLVPVGVGLPAARLRSLQGVETVLDVGANVGQFAERLRDGGYVGTIVSFEPGATAASILRRKAARDARWEARKVAVGDESGTAVLHVAENSVSSSLLEVGALHLGAAPRSVPASHEEVVVSTLDLEAAALDSPFFLKLDVQGYEKAALAGATQTLGRTSAVQIEVSFEQLYDGEAEWIELVEILQEQNFRVRYLEPGFEAAQTGHLLQCDLLFARQRR